MELKWSGWVVALCLFKDADIKESNGSLLWLTGKVLLLLLMRGAGGTPFPMEEDLFHLAFLEKNIYS